MFCQLAEVLTDHLEYETHVFIKKMMIECYYVDF